MRKLENLLGRQFGRLSVLARGDEVWVCKCSCGTQTTANTSQLRRGGKNSCGCLRKEVASTRSKTHGMSSKPIYRIWAQMIQRCNNPKNQKYPRYGGRGILVCASWMSFDVFYADVGERPDGASLDRYPNNDGNYEPENVRWATPSQQQRNTRKTIFIDIAGERMSLLDWCDRIGIKHERAYNRIQRWGWTPERAVLTP